MKFAVKKQKQLSGAKLYVYIFQISSLLPLVYIFAVSGYAGLITKKSISGIIFDSGMCLIPRLEALGLSYLYRISESEIAVYFALLLFALIFGIICNKLLNGKYKTAKIIRYVFMALILADLVIRAMPFGFNSAFELPFEAAGFALRLACLALVVLDLTADKKSENKAEKAQ